MLVCFQEYAIVGEPVYQALSSDSVAADGETAISAEGWALLGGRAAGRETAGGQWVVGSINEDARLSTEELEGSASAGDKIIEVTTQALPDLA